MGDSAESSSLQKGSETVAEIFVVQTDIRRCDVREIEEPSFAL